MSGCLVMKNMIFDRWILQILRLDHEIIFLLGADREWDMIGVYCFIWGRIWTQNVVLIFNILFCFSDR
jgi:hypothetical protein